MAKSKNKVAATSFLMKAIDSSGTIETSSVKVTGEILKLVVEPKNKTDQHNTAKNVENLFDGYNPEDVKWIRFLVEVFHDIFSAYNVQVCHRKSI